MLISRFKAASKEAHDKAIEVWNEFLAERALHEGINVTIRTFERRMYAQREKLWAETVPLLEDGIETGNQSRVENRFLYDLCFQLDNALKDYHISPDSIEQYLRGERFANIVDDNKQRMRSESGRQVYKPEAIEYDESTLADIIGTFHGITSAISEVKEGVDNRTPVSTEGGGVDLPEFVAERRTQVMLALLILVDNHGLYVPEKKSIGKSPYSPPFNQTRLAEILAMINNRPVNLYQQAIRDVLQGWRKLSNNSVLEKAKALHTMISDPLGKSSLTIFIKEELELIKMDRDQDGLL